MGAGNAGLRNTQSPGNLHLAEVLPVAQHDHIALTQGEPVENPPHPPAEPAEIHRPIKIRAGGDELPRVQLLMPAFARRPAPVQLEHPAEHHLPGVGAERNRAPEIRLLKVAESAGRFDQAQVAFLLEVIPFDPGRHPVDQGTGELAGQRKVLFDQVIRRFLQTALIISDRKTNEVRNR